MTHAITARQRNMRLAAEPNSRRNAVTCFVRRVLTRLSFAVAALGFVNLGGADATLNALANANAAQPNPSAEVKALAQLPAMIWTIDADGDGDADFSNPTHSGVRGVDAFGSGDFGARRDAGKRRHHGVDYVAAVGALVRAPISGEVSRLGYAYRGVGRLRIVEIVNPETKYTARVLYVAPTVSVGDVVVAGDEIGAAQDLSRRYPGITNHVHVELRDARRRLLDASEQLPSKSMLQAQRAGAAPSVL
ncbi:M23 family metallopeptidase [Vitreimonas sp.]|uniref:M23 family metallopeptidase n=1 Tax=Vitreimonas sp. TaxID=3069702 RepID=UPI002D790190|nr:M23 family metallopeptidase [Vitreimonas sp.]